MTETSDRTNTEQHTTSDEEMRKLLKPEPRADDVLLVLKELYADRPAANIEIIKELDSYDDVNFWIKVDRKNFLCKVHNGVESRDYIHVVRNESDEAEGGTTPSVIHLQNAVMQHLDRHGISTSNPIHTTIASLPVISKEHSPCELVVRVLKWVEGRTMCAVPVLPIECVADAGRFLGRIDKALDAFGDGAPAGTRFHAWDQKNTLDIKPYIKSIQNLDRRAMILSIIDAFQTEIIGTGDYEKFRIGINQGDYNDANIIVDDDFLVSGVIDFGDSVASWRVLDVAVAMAYATLSVYGKSGRGISAAAALLRGFASVYELNEMERKHLHLLMSCRLACSVTLGAYSYEQNPGNEYLLLHAQPAWDMLELIWGYDKTKRPKLRSILNQAFERACLVPPSDAHKEDGVINCADLTFPDPKFDDVLRALRLTTKEEYIQATNHNL